MSRPRQIDVGSVVPEGKGKKLLNIPHHPRYRATKDGYIIDMLECTCIYRGSGVLPNGINPSGSTFQFVRRDFMNAFYGQFPEADIVVGDPSRYDAANMHYKIESAYRVAEDMFLINGVEFKRIPTPHSTQYYVSRKGVIINENTLRPLSYHATKNYSTVVISTPQYERRQRDIYVHHAVFDTWIGGREPGKINGVIDHIDDDKGNNVDTNLQLISNQENIRKARESLMKSYDTVVAVAFRTWDPDVLDQMCKWMAEDNYSVSKICDLLGLDHARDRHAVASLLTKMRMGKSNVEVAGNYDFSNYDPMQLKIREQSIPNSTYNAILALHNLGYSSPRIAEILEISAVTVRRFIRKLDKSRESRVRQLLDREGSSTIESANYDEDRVWINE